MEKYRKMSLGKILGAAYIEVRGLGINGKGVYLKHGIAGFFANKDFHAANNVGKVLILYSAYYFCKDLMHYSDPLNINPE
jgi:hypothetical protein